MKLVTFHTQELGEFYVNPEHVIAVFAYRENQNFVADGTVLLLPAGAQRVREQLQDVLATLQQSPLVTE